MTAATALMCPDEIKKYATGVKKKSLIYDVRDYLLHLGWKVACSKESGQPRFCYTSPNGRNYYSLRKLCQDWASKPLISQEGNNAQSLLLDYSSEHNGDCVFQERGLLAEQENEGKISDDCLVQDSRALISFVSEADVLVVEPEFCPQAVIAWYTLTGEDKSSPRFKDLSKSNLSLKAKQHLSALGWVFWYADKKGKKELRYKSPCSGKIYYSLRMACKSCIEDGRCGPVESVFADHEPAEIVNLRPGVECPSTTIISPDSVQASLKQLKTRRKRKKESFHNEWSKGQSQTNLEAFNSVRGVKRGRYLRSSKRVRKAAVNSDSLQRNPRTVISWLIDSKVILPRAKVQYLGGSKAVKKGRISREGIKCDCCFKVFSISGFEAHAGSTKHRPAANIFLEDGRSLMDCQKEALHNHEVKVSLNSQGRKKDLMEGDGPQDENDSICSVCHYGGELILCDRCPSAFHQSCLGLKEVPDGDWFCPSCCCKLCSQARYNYEEDCADYVDNSLLTCDQCELKYHIGCLKSKGFGMLKYSPHENWFCSKDCENIFLGLQDLIGKPIPVGVDNLTWTLLKSMKSGNSEGDTSDIEARTLIESKLNVALEVMHECFEPVIETHTGRDLVGDVVFSRGSELNRLSFQGFYTVILERYDEVITVATVRIYGKNVAEVPLVATRFQFRRLGMCRILMNELEKKLSELGVESMTLPAVHTVLNTWINSFGFVRMTDSERSQFLDYTFLDFQDTIPCQKLLKTHPSMESRTLRPTPCVELQQNHHTSSFPSCITEACY